MKSFQIFAFLVSILVAACGSKLNSEPPPAASAFKAATRQNQVRIRMKSADKEWHLDRAVEYVQNEYRLSAPVTLPVDKLDEIAIFAGATQLAQVRWDAKMKAGHSILFSGRKLKIEFRSLPEPVKLEWLQKHDAAPSRRLATTGKMLIGGIKVKNLAPDSVRIQYAKSGWARISQEERFWRMSGDHACFYKSEYSSRQLNYDIQVELGGDGETLLPQEERIVPVFAFGDAAKALNELKIPVHGPEAYHRNYLYLGRVSDFAGRGLPPGGVIACVPDRTVVSKLYDFPHGLERIAPTLKFSPLIRSVQTAFANDGAVHRVQEIPEVKGFLGFSQP